MKPDEQIKALRYCANSKGPCSECPGWTGKYDDDCMVFHMRQAADLIEKLTAEVERLKPYEQAIDQILKPDNDEMMGRTR